MIVFCYQKLILVHGEVSTAWNTALVAHAIFACFLLSWIQAIVRNPGYVTPSTRISPPQEVDPSLAPESVVTICNKCSPPCVRPPRARHCSKCHRCVLRFDHHCPYLNNCVGIYNYKFLVQSIFFMIILLAYGVASIRLYHSRHPPRVWFVCNSIVHVPF